MRPRVVVVGAGFAGIECAKALAGEPVDVTIVDRQNFHTFTALLYQVASAELSPSDVGFPVRGIFRRAGNVACRQATVTGVDWPARRLLLEGGDELGFDHLVVAAGATTNWFGVQGAEEHGFALYGMADAIRLRNHILRRFEEADARVGEAEEGDLTVVVVGAGPTGVETAGALVELFHRVLAKDFPRLDVTRARVVLVEMGDRLLGSFSEVAGAHALDELRSRGVELCLGERVAAVAGNGVRLASGRLIATRTLVWAAGVQAGPLAGALGVEQTAGGRIVVEPDLRVPGHPEVFVAGDLAAAMGRDGALLSQVAPVARQAGRHAGRSIARLVRGMAPEPFRYRDRGTMATIGRRAAVADLPFGVRLTGTLGWLAWLFLHLWFLVGFRNRLVVFLNWAWNYVTFDRGARLIVPTAERSASR